MADRAEKRRSWSGGRLRGWVVLGSKGCRGVLADFGDKRLLRGDACSGFTSLALLALPLLLDEDFFTGEWERWVFEWEEDASSLSSLVEAGVFFGFLGDLEKSFCIEKVFLGWRR